jgi:type VI secretion system protein ImpL
VVFTLLWLWLLLGVVSWRVWRKMQQLKAERQHEVVLEQDPVKGLIDRQALFLDRWLQALNTHLGKGALYAMPWYLVLGLPGSGKSSLIHRANPANKLNPRLDTELRRGAGSAGGLLVGGTGSDAGSRRGAALPERSRTGSAGAQA